MVESMRVAESIRGWKPGDPVVEFFASRIARTMSKLDALAEIADANVQALASETDRALQTLVPANRNLALANAAALTAESQRQLEAQEHAHARSLRQDVRMADFIARRPAGAREQTLPLPELPPRFATGAKCAQYLRRWQRERGIRCPQCGARSLYDLKSKAKFECDSCRCQWSVRAGTVFENSKLPLDIWFGAIQMILAAPEVSAALLSQQLEALRIETARQLKLRISLALASPERSTLLAGLDEVFAINPALTAQHLEKETHLDSPPISSCYTKPS